MFAFPYIFCYLYQVIDIIGEIAITKPEDEAVSRPRILREAERLFMAKGFAAVSTRDICIAAGVKQPSLYHHFGSKEGLYLAVAQHWFDELGIGIQAAIAQGGTIREQLHGIAVLLWSGAAGEYQTMQRDAMMMMPDDHLQIIAGIVWRILIAPVSDVMRAAIAAGDLPPHADPFVLTQIFWGLVDGISGNYRRNEPLPSPDANLAIIDFFLAGARALPPEAYAGWPSLRGNARLFPPSHSQEETHD